MWRDLTVFHYLVNWSIIQLVASDRYVIRSKHQLTCKCIKVICLCYLCNTVQICPLTSSVLREAVPKKGQKSIIELAYLTKACSEDQLKAGV